MFVCVRIETMPAMICCYSNSFRNLLAVLCLHFVHLVFAVSPFVIVISVERVPKAKTRTNVPMLPAIDGVAAVQDIAAVVKTTEVIVS